MIDLYYKKDIKNLSKVLELTDDQWAVIDANLDDDTYFDGYAQVRDCMVIVFQTLDGGPAMAVAEYEGAITDEALSFYHNGG
jgi:hypothetical protein